MNSAGIYIHVPFCLRKCPYCAFYSVKYCADTAQRYKEAVIRNIVGYGERYRGCLPVDTVYFGGGTPSLLSPFEVSEILESIRRSFRLSPGAEITLEVNPCTVDLSHMEGYARAGINRVSIGVQSANDEELKLLGRLHNFSDAREAVIAARQAGITNISCDLMIGTPGQTLESVIDSAKKIASLGAEHISCYLLKIEEGTPYDCGKIKALVADDDLSSDMYLAVCRELRALGFERYEISNFCRPGMRSRHNMKYWLREDYLGIGPSAHSFMYGRRFYAPSELDSFISSPMQTELEEGSVDPLEEYVMLSLRLIDGLSYSELGSLGGDADAASKRAEKFVGGGLAESDGRRLWLTDKGALVSNGVILEMYLAASGEAE